MSDDGGDKGPARMAAEQASHDSSSRERRSSVRVPVTMWVEEITAGTQVFRRAGNLSPGGLYLDKTIPMPIGSRVTLRFSLPGQDETLVAEAEVVSIDPDEELGMGVKFVETDPETRARIERFVKLASGQ